MAPRQLRRIILDQKIFEGMRIRNVYKRGERIERERVTRIKDPESRRAYDLTETEMMNALRRAEMQIHALPAQTDIQQIINRASAGYRLHGEIATKPVSLESMTWLVDHAHGGEQQDFGLTNTREGPRYT